MRTWWSSRVEAATRAVKAHPLFGTAVYAHAVASHTAFIADVALDVYLVAQLYGTANPWWASLTLTFVLAQYIATMVGIYRYVRSTVSGSDTELGPEERALMRALYLGPVGVLGLDVLLAVRAFNRSRLYIPSAVLCCCCCLCDLPDDYGSLAAFFQWYATVRIAYESALEAMPQVLLQTYIFAKFALVTHEQEFPVNPLVLGLSLATSAAQLVTKVLLPAGRARMNPVVYVLRLGQGMPLDELANNATEELRLAVLPNGPALETLVAALKANTSVVRVIAPPPVGDLDCTAEAWELSEEQCTHPLVLAVLQRASTTVQRVIAPPPVGDLDSTAEEWELSEEQWGHPLVGALLSRNVRPATVELRSAAPRSSRAAELEALARAVGQPSAEVLMRVGFAQWKGKTAVVQEHGRALLHLVRTSTALVSLKLDLTGISDGLVCALADVLKGNRTLTNLYLSYNGLGDPSGTALADALEHNSTLQELWLSRNNLSDSTKQAIRQAWGSRPNGLFL